MRFSFIIFALSAVASTAYAAITTRHSVPVCIEECVADTLGFTTCNLDDTKCLCEDEQFVNLLASCVQKACPPNVAQEAAEEFQEICSAAEKGKPHSSMPGMPSKSSATPTSTKY